MKFIKGVCVYQVFPVREMIDFHNRCVIGISLILHMNFKLCMIQMFFFLFLLLFFAVFFFFLFFYLTNFVTGCAAISF